MAVTKIRRISSWTLIAVMIISVVVLAMFYLGGVVDPAAENKEPVNTSLLLYWGYTIVLASIVGLVIFGLFQFVASLKTKPKAALGSLIVLVAFAAILGIAYSIGDTTPLPNINADSAHFNTDSWLKISDMWIYTIYTLLAVCVLAMIAGSVKTVLKK
jgi:type III secretory pathway component EscS